MFKVNNKDNRVNNKVNNKDANGVVLAYLLLTFYIFHTLF